GDNDLDIIVTTGAARRPVAVWINDGEGGFKEGDLAAYPSWIWQDGYSMSWRPLSRPSQLFCDFGRRSGSAALSEAWLADPFVVSNSRPAPRPELLISSSRADDFLSRAPPSLL